MRKKILEETFYGKQDISYVEVFFALCKNYLALLNTCPLQTLQGRQFIFRIYGDSWLKGAFMKNKDEHKRDFKKAMTTTATSLNEQKK